MDAELMSLNAKLLRDGTAKIRRDEYAILKNDEERFSYTLSLLEKYKITPDVRVEEKSNKLSCENRIAGNDLYVSKEFSKKKDEVLELYTKSIAFAETHSQELALAYANRSALLFEVGLYDHCLADIERALTLDYPNELKPKLLMRRVNCHKSLGKNCEEKLEESIEETRRCIAETYLGDERKLNESTKILTSPVKLKPQRILINEDEFRPETPMDNPEIPGVSGALKISYDKIYGRHITATKKIRPGEIIAVQNGYATILQSSNFYTHCSNCLRQTWSAVPCRYCPTVVYCDESCRDEAWEKHHDVECKVTGAMLKFDFNLLSFMSLRLAIRAVRDAGSFENLRIKLEEVDAWEDPRTKGFTGSPPILNENDYSSVYTLAKNTEKRSGPDLFGRSFNAVYILYCVGTLSNFFGEKFSPDITSVRKNPWSIFVGGLITRHQQIIPSNVHGVTETRGLGENQRGASIIPFLSFFNHSCESVIARNHYGSKVVVYAVKPIEAGEQVYDNYGAHYAVNDLQSRRQKIKRQFYFFCECRACKEDWPLYQNIPTWKEKNLDRKDKLKLQKTLKNFNKYVDLATVGKIRDKLHIMKDLERMIEVLLQCVDLPCRDFNDISETLKRFHALISIRYQSLSEPAEQL